MKKGDKARGYGVAIATLVVMGAVLAGLPDIAMATSKFNIGDTVEVTANLNARTGPGTGYPEITDPDYPGYAPKGTLGKILSGPSSGDGYIWWEVDFSTGLYSGWAVENYLELKPPSAPTTTSPGTGSAPGPVIDDLTPTLQWNAVSGAGYYALAIREDPPNGPIVCNPQQVYGTSHSVPSGKLKHGHEYRWNMQAHNSAGWSDISNTLYFQTPQEVDLTVTSIKAPTSAEAGGSLAVSWTVKNQGNVASGSFHNRISLATTPYGTDISLGNFAMGSIAAGSSSSDAEVPKIPETISPGYYYVTVFADGFDDVTESDENNNINKAPNQIHITSNNPPNTLSNPSPSNHATGQSIHADLSWTGGDPDAGDTVTYDVCFGTSTSPPLISNGQSGTTYDPGTLSYNTKYYWKIIATDNHGASTSGSLWDFTTGSAPNNPPNTPSTPSGPSSGYTVTSYTYSTSATDPDGYLVKYTFDWGDGTTSETGFVNSGTTASKSHSWSSAGTYYVKAKATDSKGASSGRSSSKAVMITQSINDNQKQQEILNRVNSYRGSLLAELVLAIIRQEGGEGAFHVNGWDYNSFYRESDGHWAQPTNGDGIMQVTAASGYHERSGTYTHDRDGYDHAINDGCDYLLEHYNTYSSYAQATLHYNTGPNSLYIYLGKNWGDWNYLSHVAEHLGDFVPNAYGLQNQNLANTLNQGQNILNDYLYNKGLATGQSVDYYRPYQEQLDKELPNIEASISIGDWVQTSDELNVRKDHWIDDNVIWTAPKGSLGVVIDGPQSGSGYTWWKIRYDYAPNDWKPIIIGWSSQHRIEKYSPPSPPPKFLTLPFRDSDIKIQQGWVYTWTSNPNAHKGTDYIKGTIDSSSSWQSFDVVAAADGWATQSEQLGGTGVYGKFVLIRHDKQDYVGNDYFTLYAHLDSVASGIPYQDRNNIDYNYNDPSKWKSVKRGEVIGRAGNTGASSTGIHLHFEAQRKAYANYKTDPYDLYKNRSFYPGGGSYTSSGSRYLWTTDPPSLPSIPSDIGYAVLVAGQGDVKFWKPWEYGTQWITNRNVNRAYQVLRNLGFDDDRILYLNNNPQDADGDGDNDVDSACTVNDFISAMEWARERVGEHSPFILYMSGHGEKDPEVFFLDVDKSEGITPSLFDQQLSMFPEGTRMLIVIDACYSGCFIAAPETISASNRIIITSAHADRKVPAFLNYIFWSPEFWQCVQQGKDARWAFIKGTEAANDALTRAFWAGLIPPPEPADFCQPWLDDNGDAVGHPPESLGDDGELAATMIIGVPGGPPSVGEGAPNPQLFGDCYDRNGGASVLGDPINKVHRWGNGYIQDFQGGGGYEGAIMQPDGVNCAYVVYGSIWSKYLILGGAEGLLEYPSTDELEGSVSSITGARCRYNKFKGGAIVHRKASGHCEAKTVYLGWGIFNKWEELNYGESDLGLPTSDEREVPQSGAEGFDTTGIVCDFEGGRIYWHRTGKYETKAFEVHGAINGTYQKEGGSGGWLGFPISDEYKDSKTGYARSNFEGGYITTPNGIEYYAYPNDKILPSAPIISSSTHPDESGWYCNRNPTFSWTTPSDPSGTTGYSYTLDHSSTTTPDETCDTIGNTKSYTDLAYDIWYFHVRAKDNADNWGPVDHYKVQIENCDDKDGWYDTGETKWATTTVYECKYDQKEQKEQEYRDYYCSGGSCTRKITKAQWVDAGKTRTVNKPDGTDCGYDYHDGWVNYCKGDEMWKRRQFHDFYCEGGSCVDHTSWVDDQLVENCNARDGWVDTGDTRWIDDPGNECKEKQQKKQEYHDYTCSGGSCDYSVTDTKWINTGITRNKDEGTICGCTANNTLKECSDGSCSDTGICNSTICNADIACDGKKPEDPCDTNKKCNSNCKCSPSGTTESGELSTISFDPSNPKTSAGSTTTINITLDKAPNGLSGYNLTVSLSNTSVAEIVSVNSPSWAALYDNSTLPADSVWIKATDLTDQVKSGATDVNLGTLTFRGDNRGTSDIVITVTKMDDDKGYSINPNTISGQIEVTIISVSVIPIPEHTYSPTDTDSDGLYEDLNGNGIKDFDDIVQFFKYIEWIQSNEQIHCFDFNGNGRLDFNDIVELFEGV